MYFYTLVYWAVYYKVIVNGGKNNSRPFNSKMIGSSDIIDLVHSDDKDYDSTDKMSSLKLLFPPDTKPMKWVN